MSVSGAEISAEAATGCASRRWPLERILFALAGTITGLSALVSALVSPWFLLLTAFVALNQLLFAGVGDCPASLILRHVFGAERGCAR
jgi:Zn-dependent protease